MGVFKLTLLSAVAMLAFAANSLLCRMALLETQITPAAFTFWRIASGAVALALLVMARKHKPLGEGSFPSALALMVYAAGFSFAYVNMTTGAGALLLFGAVQMTMISWGLIKGERLNAVQWLGFVFASAGLVLLLLPNAAVPDLSSALLMVIAGVAWGVYSLRGKISPLPIEATAGNFLRATPLALLLLIPWWPAVSSEHLDGVLLAVASGALASGLGYALWYGVLPHIAAIKAATLQLSVPVLAVLAGWLLLGEVVSFRVLLSSTLVLGGVALVIWTKQVKAR